MNKNFRVFIFILLIFSFSCKEKAKEQFDLTSQTWEQIEKEASGKTVNWMMWTGDPSINAYVNNFVVPKIKVKYNINLKISSGQGSVVVSNLLAEKDAGKEESELDMVWINGETFYQLRQVDALFGPFTDKLPNSNAIDFSNRFIGFDFQQPVNGFECPWGNVQMCLIYDANRLPKPPQTLVELSSFVKANPGKFTFPNDFTGMTLLKAWLIEFAGGEKELAGKFNDEKYKKSSTKLWKYINANKINFWKQGKTFPNAVAPLHQLFVNKEVDITISNNDAEAENKVLQGFFPKTTRSYVPEYGTIQNSHYLGLVKNSTNKAAAMVVINFLVSPEAQLNKMNPATWGDGTVLDKNKLDSEWKQKFEKAAERKYSPKREDIESKALAELDPMYMVRLYDDFRKFVIEK